MYDVHPCTLQCIQSVESFPVRNSTTFSTRRVKSKTHVGFYRWWIYRAKKTSDDQYRLYREIKRCAILIGLQYLCFDVSLTKLLNFVTLTCIAQYNHADDVWNSRKSRQKINKDNRAPKMNIKYQFQSCLRKKPSETLCRLFTNLWFFEGFSVFFPPTCPFRHLATALLRVLCHNSIIISYFPFGHFFEYHFICVLAYRSVPTIRTLHHVTYENPRAVSRDGKITTTLAKHRIRYIIRYTYCLHCPCEITSATCLRHIITNRVEFIKGLLFLFFKHFSATALAKQRTFRK